MKTTLATATVILSLLGSCLMAAEAPTAAASVEQQFQQADVQLAIEQYKKLRRAAFDLTLKLQTEITQSEDQRKQLERTRDQLQEQAEQLRAETLKVAAVALARTR